MKIRFSILGIANALLFATVLFALSIVATLAETDGKLEAAIVAWLDDDDRVALPLLAELATEGNEDAMILLGQISKTPGGLSPYLAGLSREERVRLLKAPNGKFSVSWLKRVQKKRALAEALLGVDHPDNRLEAALLLLELNEPGQALRAYGRLINYGVPRNFSNAIAGLQLPREMKPFKWYALAYKHVDEAAIERALADIADSTLSAYAYLALVHHLLNEQDQQGIDLKLIVAVLHGDRGPDKTETLANISALNDRAFEILGPLAELQPVRRACEELCPDEVAACLRTGYRLLGGYYGLLQVQSPVEAIIPKARYFSSKRIRYDMLRQMGASFTPYWIDRRPEIVNKCIAKQVYEQTSFRQFHFSDAHTRFLGVK